MADVVLISGSLRKDSLNTTALRTVARLLREPEDTLGSVHTATLLPVGLLPLYDGDVELADSSDAVRDAKALVGAADVLIISTPAYNGEMSGALKNALDWLSRPAGGGALAGKHVAVLSASPGARGGLDAQAALVGVLRRCGAEVLGCAPVAFGAAHDIASADGEFTDPGVVAELAALVDAVLDAAGHRAGART
ncbi:NADPH-dependent FMN reductase [Streptomyces sp. NPDC049813]|uniref:NADPH-dependent FMN reductase n=1 Tax=Streptomyces sp. NPDC049813 TaxID=3365597 RepID=UPI0037A44D62